MNKRIMVVVAHPDDEILGAGATLRRHVEDKDEVYCLILSRGVTARKNFEKTEIDNLLVHSKNAGNVIGFKESYYEDLPDNSFDTVSLLEVTQIIEKYLEKIKPDVIYTQFENDLNIDHRITCQAVVTASRPCNENCPEEIYCFETLSSTEWQNKQYKQFCPNVYIDVEKCIEKKIEAMSKYLAEIREYPHSRSAEGIKILAQYRGLESGLLYAEAFCLIRKIEK